MELSVFPSPYLQTPIAEHPHQKAENLLYRRQRISGVRPFTEGGDCNGILILLRFSNSLMIVGTTQAAQILKLSNARVRILLVTGRVKGAYKTGNMWLMPLFNGKPKIERGTRGPAPTWDCEEEHSPDPKPEDRNCEDRNSEDLKPEDPKPKDRKSKKSKKSAKTIIHVNSQTLQRNYKNNEREPIITVKRGQSNIYGHEVEISGRCRVVYRPDKPNKGGARVWIETHSEVRVFDLGNMTHLLSPPSSGTRG